MSNDQKLARAVDVVCLGETMGQFVPADGRGVEDADSFSLQHAGAESNVAIGLARLGFQTAWSSRLGNDAIGRRVLSAVKRENVDTSLVATMDDRPTGIFLKDPGLSGSSVSYYRRGSAASHIDRSDVDRALGASPRIIHFSGVTPALSVSCDDAVGYGVAAARGLDVTTSFDVNYRSALWVGRESAAARLAELANASDIVFVGLDEASSLWQVETAEEVRRILPGAGTLVVKDSALRATSFDGETTMVPALRMDVVESVGAGDAFAAGWLAAFLGGRTPSIALRFGHLLAGAALASFSDQGEPVSATAIEQLANDEAMWAAHEGPAPL